MERRRCGHAFACLSWACLGKPPGTHGPRSAFDSASMASNVCVCLRVSADRDAPADLCYRLAADPSGSRMRVCTSPSAHHHRAQPPGTPHRRAGRLCMFPESIVCAQCQLLCTALLMAAGLQMRLIAGTWLSQPCGASATLLHYCSCLLLCVGALSRRCCQHQSLQLATC